MLRADTARLLRALALTCVGILAGAVEAPAAVPTDPLGVSQKLPAPSPHWMWVNDFVFPHMVDGQALLLDGDKGAFLGMLSTGFGFSRLVIPSDGKVIYSPETYFSRGTRGTRTDVVSIYDPRTLSPIGEIGIPAKRASNVPMMSNSVLTDDDRFLLIYNFNPGQSVTVVDTRTRKFAGEIETAGCALVYPTGNRSFFSICADGALLDVHLGEDGKAANKKRSARIFDVEHDPVTEKGVRLGDTWYFVSFDGMMFPVKVTASGLVAGEKWSLLSAADRQQSWRPGGLQQLAVHAGQKRLYSIMHKGPIYTHKDPGQDVWVYDLGTKARVQQIALKNPAGSIQLTRDAKPLMFSIFIDSTTTDVYDVASGKHLRSIANVGTTPTIMVNP
ncbi:MAG: amine dehydrogenase large subunit [Gammaproteobacteria bacterium]